jgi:signal transduction histidine kinase
MKFRLYSASAVVLCLVSALVFLGAKDVQESMQLSHEAHARAVPTLRYLEQMRFGILRIVSSTSELMVAHLTGAAEDRETPGRDKAADTEVALIEQGRGAYRGARDALLALYRDNGDRPPGFVNFQEIDQAHELLTAASERIVALVQAHAAPHELAEAKEVFEAREMRALSIVEQALNRTQEATDSQYRRLFEEITGLRNEILGLGLLVVTVLVLYSAFVIDTLRREERARREAEQLAGDNAKEIERRKRIEGRLAAHQKMEALGTMIGGIAHSVNNLMVPIITLSKMLKQDAPEGSELRQDLGRIQASGEKASKLLKDVLAFSRTGQEAAPGKCELVDSLRRTLSIARAALPAAVALQESILIEEAWVPKEEAEVDTIVFNLLTNAVDAMDGSGRIDVRLDRVTADQAMADAMAVQLQPGEYARLCIADNGCGISEKVLPHVFEPFFTTKAVGKGTGLGLSVIYGSLTQVGGDIVVNSKPGAGTRIDLFLPLLGPQGALPSVR